MPIEPIPSRVATALAVAFLTFSTPSLVHAQSSAPSSAPPSAAPALPATAATLPAPTSAPPDLAAGLDPDMIRRACHDANAVDTFAWVATGVYALTGIGLVVWGSVYPTPDPRYTPVGIAYVRGIGPGLILGAIGVPIARGLFDTGNPLHSVCATMERNRRAHADNAYDTYTADRVLRIVGAPPTFVLPLLIGIATAGCIALSIIPFAINNHDVAGPAGGISAAAVAAWVVLPPTPQQSAARQYASGHYAAGTHASATVPTTWAITPLANAAGLAISGTF